jgi:hypothetical protein
MSSSRSLALHLSASDNEATLKVITIWPAARHGMLAAPTSYNAEDQHQLSISACTTEQREARPQIAVEIPQHSWTKTIFRSHFAIEGYVLR